MTLFALPAQAQTLVNDYGGLQSATAAGGSGDISLANNISGTAQLTIERSLTLDLNGKNLSIILDDPTGQASNGIKINAGGITLTIRDSGGGGVLTVTNGAAVNPTAGNGAAINTTDGFLVIESGTVIATGGRLGAGIGGGVDGDGGTITISGGEVIAKGDFDGAGIGGGVDGNGGTITINGGTVTATGGSRSAGIGGGYQGVGGTITISGGTITANGGEYGAGIGGGNGNGGTIMISDGTVTANGGLYSAGIGGGWGGNGGTITINGDAMVAATGGNALGNISAGAGIGSGGTNSNAAIPIGSIAITTTGTVTATGGAGAGTYGAGAAIGQGGYGGGNGAGIANVPVTAHPANQTATVGQTAAFAFVVTPVGTTPPAPAYQWEVSSGGAFANVTGGAGGTTASYTTVATTAAMNGNLYRNVATVSNVNGNNSGTITYTSHPATLMVMNALASPTLTLTANPAGSVALSNSVTLTATLTGAVPLDGHSIEFFVDGASVGTGTTNAAGVATFAFAPLNAGTYVFGAEFSGDVDNDRAEAAINGYVVRPAGGTVGAVASIPTLNPAMLMLLALALGGMAFRQNRRKV